MIKDIFVLDDILPKSYQDVLEEEMLGMNIPWTHIRDVALNDTDVNHLTNSGVKLNLRPGFSYRFFQMSEGVQSPLWPLVRPIVVEACSRINFPIVQIISARSFLTTSLADKVEYDNPHVDLSIQHLACLYYVSDSDGDTFLFDQRSDNVSPEKLDTNSLKVIKRISPKKGRVVLFDGKIYHSSSRPTTGSRCIINFDLF